MKPRKARFEGCLTALVTPFADGELDLDALGRLVDQQLREGTDGLVLCGTTAESPTLTDAEQAEIVEFVGQRAAGRCPIIVGTGTNCTAKTVSLSQRARDLGADGLMIVAPYYNKPTQEGLRRHFASVAEQVELPIVLYNIPGRCGVEIQPETIARLFEEIDHIVAVKHATGSVDGARILRQHCPIDILSGDDPLTLALLEVGAIGVISVLSNLLPRRVKAMTDAYRAGNSAAAAAIHEQLLELGQGLLTLSSNPIPIKTALALRGLIREEFRLPMCALDPQSRRRLVALLERHDLLPAVRTPAPGAAPAILTQAQVEA
jgi:4-hydroxy-tetrahydrodipicolinate synthase